ncbi:MAG: Rod shape-determining protein RodA [Firmicutes bacterium ADurb.Bin182]|nr:MAG: Rod shape-determining protein RodA [Firmicutes bacterium ADurb.Bin182]
MSILDKKLIKNLDYFTIAVVFALVCFGLVSIASIMASPFDGKEATLSDYIQKLNLEYVERQIVNFLVGIAAMLIVLVIDYHMLKGFINYIYYANVALLLILLLAGESTRGIFGWFKIGTRMFQPSELCKISLIVMISKIVSDSMDRDGSLKRFKEIMKALVYFIVPFFLVYKQPDMGTAFVFIAILFCIFFVGRINWKYIAGAVLFSAAALPLTYFYLITPDQKNRIDSFLNPGRDARGLDYNVIQSKTSIGSGQLNGRGFFTDGTLAQLKYVPERHTDFVFSGIVEGVGFIGGTILIALYFVLIFRWLWIAAKAKDNFGTCLVTGCLGMLAAHVFENVGMTMGLMPVTGIPLPFISYGGSNLLTNMIAVGIVLNVWMRRPARR